MILFLLCFQDSLYRQFKDYPELLDLVNKVYVDAVDSDALMESSFQGVLNALDPNASYVPQGTPRKALREKVYRRFGLVICKKEGLGQIFQVVPHSPADIAGLEPNMLVSHIADKPLRTRPLYTVLQTLAESNEPLDFRVLNNDAPKVLTLNPGVWKKIPEPSIEGDLVIHINLPYFVSGFEEKIKSAIGNKPHAKVLLDLRENAYGSLSDMDALANLFFPKGPYGLIVGKNQKETLSVHDGPGFLCELWVWTSERTAGPAEAFAFFCQNTRRAAVIGESTSGLSYFFDHFPLKQGGFLEFSTRSFAYENQFLQGHGVLVPELHQVKNKKEALALISGEK